MQVIESRATCVGDRIKIVYNNCRVVIAVPHVSETGEDTLTIAAVAIVRGTSPAKIRELRSAVSYL